jgi:hypothetical protein
MEGDFNTSEHLINEAARRGLFNEYISGCKYKPQWNRIQSEPQGGLLVFFVDFCERANAALQTHHQCGAVIKCALMFRPGLFISLEDGMEQRK